MTPAEALKLLDGAIIDRPAKSRINHLFTRGQVFDIVYGGIVAIQKKRPDRPLDSIMVLRVHQAVTNQRRPQILAKGAKP